MKKRETGIFGYTLDIERRVKTCKQSDSSYSIENTNPKYIIDRISCCTTNLCNDATSEHQLIKKIANNLLLAIISSIILHA